jgi:hypothetical protein
MTEVSSNKNPHITPIVGTIEGTKLQLYNWHGSWIIVGSGFNTRILDNIQNRRTHIRQNMILIAGPPGEGKSYFALRLAQIFDKKFDPGLQIVFERSHLLHLLGGNSPLKRGQIIMIDEAQFAMGARGWYEQIQKDLMEHIEAVRSKGYIIIIVALHQELLDKIIRQYVLSHMMWMQGRGKAAVYEFKLSPFAKEAYHPKIGNLSLQLPDIEQCAFPSCLLCKFSKTCMTDRARYERLKEAFLNKMNAESKGKVDAKEQKASIRDWGLLMQYVIADKDKLEYIKNSGRADPMFVQLILEEHKIIISEAEAGKLVKRGIVKYPEVFKKQKMNVRDE